MTEKYIHEKYKIFLEEQRHHDEVQMSLRVQQITHRNIELELGPFFHFFLGVGS